MSVIRSRDLGRPPGCCPDCWDEQDHHPYDVGQESFYCPHNRIWAIVKSDYTGWQIQTGVSQQQVEQHMEIAAQGHDMYVSRFSRLN